MDLARTGTLHTAVAAADHALRHELCSFDELMAEVDAVPPRVRGRTTARLVGALADPLSMSAGESLSRVQMFLLNLPKPELQKEIRDAAGLVGFVDFGWEGVVGEFDGKVKYRVAEGASPADAGEIVWREKQREDRLRRQVRVARWTWAIALDRARLGARLAEYGIRPTAGQHVGRSGCSVRLLRRTFSCLTGPAPPEPTLRAKSGAFRRLRWFSPRQGRIWP